jgi:hypothetical protein
MTSPECKLRPGAGADVADADRGVGVDDDFHLHGFDNGDGFDRRNGGAGFDQDIPDAVTPSASAASFLA